MPDSKHKLNCGSLAWSVATIVLCWSWNF